MGTDGVKPRRTGSMLYKMDTKLIVEPSSSDGTKNTWVFFVMKAGRKLRQAGWDYLRAYYYCFLSVIREVNIDIHPTILCPFRPLSMPSPPCLYI